VLEQLPAGRPATGLLSVEQRSQLTPYDRWGEGLLIGIALLAGAWRWISRAPG
jgi:apolipoprotein N-acyltransferase